MGPIVLQLMTKRFAVMPAGVNVNIICGRNVVMGVHDKMRIGGVR